MARGLADFDPAELRAYRINVYARPGRSAMSASALGQAVGASKAQILAYENGHRVPDPQRLRALAETLDISPSQLMRRAGRDLWEVADFRRARGLRAQDVVNLLSVSPKSYRRFEKEGIVPGRRPGFLDEVAALLDVTHRDLENAIDRNPDVLARRKKASELVTALAERYVFAPGPWKGPDAHDPNLVALAAAYARPVPRTRRVLTHELGELRQRNVRAQREQVIADFDTNRERQMRARAAMDRWKELYAQGLARIPLRLERFHRHAQTEDTWQVLVDLYNADARQEGPRDPGSWGVSYFFLGEESSVPPASLVEQRHDGLDLCRLTPEGSSHVRIFHELYASLYPTTRRARTAGSRSGTAKGHAAGLENTFTLSNRPERLVIPASSWQTLREEAAGKGPFWMELSPQVRLVVGPNSLTAAVASSQDVASAAQPDASDSPG